MNAWKHATTRWLQQNAPDDAPPVQPYSDYGDSFYGVESDYSNNLFPEDQSSTDSELAETMRRMGLGRNPIV